ncbi:MAG: hypothetical protein KDK25_06215, partial [Leptospiraceae bacterium]|nr:hypothetical protein [Leptospiraceae bacterium]
RKASFIRSTAFFSDVYYPTFRSLDRLDSVSRAIRKAEEKGGCSAQDVDFAELHECYGHQELMLYEALGWSDNGGHYLRSGAAEADGTRPCNVSGGSLCSHVPYATGIMRLYEAHLQLVGEAGPIQLGKADLALVHSQAGLAMQSNIVFFLEGDR